MSKGKTDVGGLDPLFALDWWKNQPPTRGEGDQEREWSIRSITSVRTAKGEIHTDEVVLTLVWWHRNAGYIKVSQQGVIGDLPRLVAKCIGEFNSTDKDPKGRTIVERRK